MIIDGKTYTTYTVDEQTLIYHQTLDEDDLGRHYIIIAGCIIFTEKEANRE